MLKSQLVILFILFLIFLCQKLVRISGAAADGDIPANLVLSPPGLGVSEMTQLILPLNLFLGLLMTLDKLYTESKITVIYTCDLSKMVLMKTAMTLAVFTAIIAVVSVIWAEPWSSRRQDEVLAEAKANPGITAPTQGQFQQATNDSSVLFIENVDGSDFRDMFLAQIQPEGNAHPSMVVTDFGHLTQLRGDFRVVTLNQGACPEGTALLYDFRITDFRDHQAIIGHQAAALDPNDADQVDMRTLWNTGTDHAHAGLGRRTTLVLTMLVVALMVAPLSVVNPRQGHVLSMLPAMLLYLLFFLIQTSPKSNGGKGKLDPASWMWTVNLVYLALATVPSLWNTVLVRCLRASFSCKGAV